MTKFNQRPGFWYGGFFISYFADLILRRTSGLMDVQSMLMTRSFHNITSQVFVSIMYPGWAPTTPTWFPCPVHFISWPEYSSSFPNVISRDTICWPLSLQWW